MSTAYEIPLRIRLIGARIPSDVLAEVVTLLDRAAGDLEREELALLQSEFRELPAVAFDATRYRLQAYDGAMVTLESARQGSLVLIGIAAGVSYWLLDKTLGETAAEAWRGSPTHARLVKYLSRRRVLRIRNLAKRIQAAPPPAKTNWPIKIDAEGNKEGIDVTVHLERKDVPGDDTPPN